MSSLLQILESDHLIEDSGLALGRQGKVYMGVETNAFLRPMAFHLTTQHPGDDVLMLGQRFARPVRVPAQDMMLPFLIERPGQLRGVPWAHAAMARLNDVGRYREAEIIAARVGSSKMGFYERESAEQYQGDQRDADGRLIDQAIPGHFTNLPAGVKFKAFDPQHPNAGFGDFMVAMLQGIASGLDTSYAELTGDLRQANYSSLRHGSLSDRDAWRAIQVWMIGRVMLPIWREWLQMSMTSQAVRLPLREIDRLGRVAWMPRGWAWIDPDKELKAQERAIDLRLDSRTHIVSQSGRSIVKTFEQIRDEENLAETMGISLERPPATEPPTDGNEETQGNE